MTRMHVDTNALILAALLAAIFQTAAADTASGTVAIGWRGDGWSGVMPADCRPPKDFDGITGHNLRWKAPLPNHGNSAPLPVGNKIFVTCDGGWPEGQDCPQLLCFDANNGKELWRQNLDHFDNLPEAEARAAKADRAEFWKQHHEACTLLWELKHADPDEARQTAIVERLKELGLEGKRQRWFLVEMASTLAWKDAAMLKSLLAIAQEPLARNVSAAVRSTYYALPGYFAAVDAAADPAAADILLKVYAHDESLSMDAAFRSALPQEKYLAWLEGIALGLQDFNARRNVLGAWRKAGPAAIPSMKRVAAAMTGEDPKILRGNKDQQLALRKDIENTIAALEKK